MPFLILPQLLAFLHPIWKIEVVQESLGKTFLGRRCNFSGRCKCRCQNHTGEWQETAGGGIVLFRNKSCDNQRDAVCQQCTLAIHTLANWWVWNAFSFSTQFAKQVWNAFIWRIMVNLEGNGHVKERGEGVTAYLENVQSRKRPNYIFPLSGVVHCIGDLGYKDTYTILYYTYTIRYNRRIRRRISGISFWLRSQAVREFWWPTKGSHP